jgi:hypothetical protein
MENSFMRGVLSKDAIQLYLDAIMEEEIARLTTEMLDEA